jgi:hypothetical protein
METKRKTTAAILLQRIRRSDWWRILIIWIVTMLLRYGLWCLMMMFLTDQAFAQPTASWKSPLIAGEVMTYKVKWSFIRLGTVTIRQFAADSGRVLIQMSVQSAPGLPFIDVHFYNQTYVSNESQSLREEIILSGKDKNEKTVYWFDQRTKHIMMEDSISGERVRRDSVSWEKECYDALGLLMHSRCMAGSGISTSLPTLNDHAISPTEVSYAKATEDIEVGAFDAPRRCHLVSGMARWVGSSFAGMKGPFSGWITDDAAAIPLKAKIEILLGSVVLELESYQSPAPSSRAQFADTVSK